MLTTQTKLVTTCKKNGQNQDYKTDVLILSHWSKTVRKTEEKMVGDRNRLSY
jgi:hypothetical protein